MKDKNKHARVQKNIQTKENTRTSKQTEEKTKQKTTTKDRTNERQKEKLEKRKAYLRVLEAPVHNQTDVVQCTLSGQWVHSALKIKAQ